ncbi:MAG TPA: alanine--tRNA ligase [Candidatus Dormibacteraeota bacterium]|nr:alanine--tRNA ligase [Candidatus Dormibacteraeota bacterium]
MDAQQIRQKYLAFFKARSHQVIPRALLVPQNDPSTLFTGSGMQPLITYLLGEDHPEGTRLVNSQTCLRAQDIEEVGDNRHTTFFEMLGNWSLGDYFKQDQLEWFWQFLTKEIGLDPNRIYVSCFIGDPKHDIPKDQESANIWKQLFKSSGIDAKEVNIGSEAEGYRLGVQDGRIFFYSDKNWWCRAGRAELMPEDEPGGPDSEMFYLFPEIVHDSKYGKNCHLNCDCGRYIELGNSVFMEYQKTKTGFTKLPRKNVDYGGGLERIAAAAINSPDVFKVSLLWPIIQKLEVLSGKSYDTHTNSMRIIADHLRGAVFLAVDGIVPSNKEQGYVMRRLIRRAIRFAFDLGISDGLCNQLIPIIISLYDKDYPEVKSRSKFILDVLNKEELLFRKTLSSGVRELAKFKTISGHDVFKLYDTFGFPAELTIEEASLNKIQILSDWRKQFDQLMEEQRNRSRTATKGEFKGGLANHSQVTTKYHTATHLMYRALRIVLGDHVIQRGSNITEERLRFDFSHDQKMTTEQIKQVEEIVNQQIDLDLPVSWSEENTKKALDSGVMGAFGDKYADTVKVYTVGDPKGKYFSREICGGPHVEHTGLLAENHKKFKITKEESSSSGVRRIKAVLA